MVAGRAAESNLSLEAASKIAMGMVGDKVEMEEEKHDNERCAQVEQHLEDTVLSIHILGRRKKEAEN